MLNSPCSKAWDMTVKEESMPTLRQTICNTNF